MKPLDPRLVRRSHAVRRFLVLAVLIGLATAVAVVAQTWLVGSVVARQFGGQPVLALAIAVGGCFLLRAVLRWAHAVVSARAASAVKEELRAEVVSDLVDPRRVGGTPRTSTVINLLGPGLDAFDGYIGRFLPQVVLATLVPPAIIVSIAWLDPLSAVIVGLTLPLVVVFMVLIGLVTKDRVESRWQALDRLGRHFADVLDGLVVLKIFNRRQEGTIRDVGERHRRATVSALRMAFLSSLVLELVATLSVALVAVSVGLRVVEDELTLQTALIVLLLTPEAFLPVRQVGAMFHDSTEGAEAVVEVLELLDHPRHAGVAPVPDLTTGEIEIRDLEVSVMGRDEPILALPRETIHAGEFVAVAGPSGSGKSTLLSVLLDFTAPTGGTVLVDGVPLPSIDPVQWRRQVAWVPQFPSFVAGTIADNVRLGNPAATDADVTAALLDAGAGDLPPHRLVTEGAADVSAGERRRLAIARALLRVRTAGAHLLLLDEPTAGLDHEREATVLAALRGLPVTVIVVAHRPETIACADRAIRLGVPSRVDA